MRAIPKRYLFILFLIPVAIYAVSYLYLAIYHGKWWLWNTVVHEGGTHTLFWTTFYASHFLGHLPSLTVVAMIFTGYGKSLLPPLSPPSNPSFIRTWIGGGSEWWKPGTGLAVLLIISTLISGIHFGWSETWEFILQQRQSVERLESGGSWLLHLPSTVLMLVFVPLYIALIAMLFGKQTDCGRGKGWLLISGALIVFFTIAATGNPLQAAAHAFTDPRYLAHAVRELATFPLTFFPIPIYYFLKHSEARMSITRNTRVFLTICAIVFVIAFAYMMIVPLQTGIGGLAQAPSFARGGRLNLLYLISSHYFEHFLDTIYFGLLCILFFDAMQMKRKSTTKLLTLN